MIDRTGKFGSQKSIKSRFEYDLDRILVKLNYVRPTKIYFSWNFAINSFSRLKSNNYTLFPMLKDCEFSKHIVKMCSYHNSCRLLLPFTFVFCPSYINFLCNNVVTHGPVLGRWGNSFKIELVLVYNKNLGQLFCPFL